MDMEMSVIDRIVALLGFALTLWQLYKTRSAADAAKVAADSAVSAIRDLEAIGKMHDISSRTRDLQRLLRDGPYSPAAAAAFELRDTVAKYSDPNNLLLRQTDAWEQAVADVQTLHDMLESLAMVPRTSIEEREHLLKEVARLHTYFTKLTAKT